MRSILIFFLLSLYVNAYSQKWQRCEVYKTNESKFKYHYCFQFENLEDSSSYTFKKKRGAEKSTIMVYDTVEALPLASIEITNLNTDSVINIATDINGSRKLRLMPGNYKIKIYAQNKDLLSFTFSLLEDEFFQLNARLGLAPELTVYQINSKSKLKEEEIIRIIQCVKKNRHNQICFSEKYHITMQI